MIIVIGSVLAKPDSLARLLDLSLEHVRRSRKEPGCLSHSVHQDAENGLRLVFVEEWLDRAALEAHFKVPASRSFVREVRALAAESPIINIYQADRQQSYPV